MPPVTVYAARIIPGVLLGIIVYVSWAVTYTIAVKQFFNPGIFGNGKTGGGIAILIIYWTLNVLVLWSFLRLLTTTALTPGYIERGDSYALDAKSEAHDPELANNPSKRSAFPPPRLEDILSKDVFVCQPDGTPRWCTTCKIWRPDRSRHCREKDRCILKLDHFCPWVGGIVSEQSMKFFIQFNTYTVLYTIFDWILATVCIAQGIQTDGYDLDRNWIAILVLGLFFMGLTGGIGFSAWANAITNHTTPENVAEASGHRWNLALRIPNGVTPAEGVRVINYPSLLDCDLDELRIYISKTSSTESSFVSENSESDKERMPLTPGSSFAIVESDSFSNPWDCGKYENWCQIMGSNVWHWFLPLWSGSPWFSFNTYRRDDSAYTSFFPTGLDVEVLRLRAGLQTLDEEKRRRYEEKRMSQFLYLLGGAGAPLKQWAATKKHQRSQQSS